MKLHVALAALLLPMIEMPLWSFASEPNSEPQAAASKAKTEWRTKIDLSHWKLTLPVGESDHGRGKPQEISPAKLTAGYVHSDYFNINSDGAIVIWCPVDGITTENSDYPRTELREVLDPMNDNVCWSAPGMHVLSARCRVSQVPSSQKVIIGQIHGYSGKANPLIKLQFTKGRIEALVKEKASKGKDVKLTFPDVASDKDFDYEIKLKDGILSVAADGATQSVNVFEKDPQWAAETLYFKAGAYVQDNEGPSSEGARVSFFKLDVNHSMVAP